MPRYRAEWRNIRTDETHAGEWDADRAVIEAWIKSREEKEKARRMFVYWIGVKP
jgi:hypothetical protein